MREPREAARNIMLLVYDMQQIQLAAEVMDVDRVVIKPLQGNRILVAAAE